MREIVLIRVYFYIPPLLFYFLHTCRDLTVWPIVVFYGSKDVFPRHLRHFWVRTKNFNISTIFRKKNPRTSLGNNGGSNDLTAIFVTWPEVTTPTDSAYNSTLTACKWCHTSWNCRQWDRKCVSASSASLMRHERKDNITFSTIFEKYAKSRYWGFVYSCESQQCTFSITATDNILDLLQLDN